MIFGRAAEQARIDGLMAAATAGRGGALLLRGEAGIGKTRLLDHAAEAAEAADGMRVLRGVGIESEAELPFAALHLLLHPYTDRVEALAGPQAAALRTAFGLEETPVRDRFLIGAATLSMLSELSGDGPLVCLLDDAQWFDQASSDALLFAARRLHAEPLVMIFAVRDGGAYPAPGIDELHLTALDGRSTAGLLAEHAGDLPALVRERIAAESGGNPLAVIELATTLAALQGNGRPAPPLPIGPLPAAGRVQDAFQAQIGGLPAATQLLLLLAAADGAAGLPVVLRAGALLGASAADLEPAERARLVTLSGEHVTFRHPLIRAAAYQAAPHTRRTEAHRALATVLTPTPPDADRRAWHLSAAATGPDEGVAAELELAARRAEHRGGSMAVTVALERAAQLSVDPAAKARRLIGAARAAYDAGLADRATELAAGAADLGGVLSVTAEAMWIKAQVAYERTSPVAAAALALAGAELIAADEPDQAVPILTEAVWCARDAGAHDLVRRCAGVLAKLEPAPAVRPVVQGLIGYGHLCDGATAAAIGPMRELVAAARHGAVDGFVERLIAGFMGMLVADDEAATEVLEALVADLREQGAAGWLPYGLEPLAIALLLRGRFGSAEAAVEEGGGLARDIGQPTQVLALDSIAAWLAAVRGDESRCRSVAEGVLEHADLHPTNAALAAWGLGLLDLAAGRPEEAASRLDGVCGGPAGHDVLIKAVPDHVEAAVRAGLTGDAVRHLAALDRWARHTDRPGAAALSHRCHALLADDRTAEHHYRTALHLHDQPPEGRYDGPPPGLSVGAYGAVSGGLHPRPPEDAYGAVSAGVCGEGDGGSYDRARTALVYGEWLRRNRRRSDARRWLAEALDGFERLGAPVWAARARTELAAVGDRRAEPSPAVHPLARLTAQELQVVRLAAGGLSNREIAVRLFLSPRTVGHHLYKAYPKLGVTKRTELTRLLG
ncbi:AAA family ATPase [Nonomuraea sp. NPDC049714]|uniref:helix-turn-helix transcriptional regulator n=1 Tax=Nonomuraea sp. NPDC049714 TaxID=3364357 RepID=UPI0037941105